MEIPKKCTFKLMDLFNMNDEPSSAIKSIVNIVTVHISPLMIDIKHKLKQNCLIKYNNSKLTEVFTLCASQIKKCVLQLFEIFKLELQHNAIIKESRTCLLERLYWCVDKLHTIKKYLENEIVDKTNIHNTSTESLFGTPMYFVNWIDNTFDVLTNLSNIVYRSHQTLCTELWKNELIDCLRSLHISIDELLLSAITLCKYCLPADQHVITARSQVVLRETKNLIAEIVNENLENPYTITVESLELPLKPTNINMLIDVLKDVLYVLETNTNSALLALLVHCFSFLEIPVTKLKTHFQDEARDKCGCDINNRDKMDECMFVKDFDLYNERLLQIGFFAVSCSTDQKRIVRVRSGLASLEVLEPYLVPALALRTLEPHALALASSWQQELAEIRDNVFLIVDPAAFVDKCKQMIHNVLLEIIRSNLPVLEDVQKIIGIACVIQEFFGVYNKYEPDVLAQRPELFTLLNDLNKAQKECKTVSAMIQNNKVNVDTNSPTTETLIKRLKLLYTLINKINSLYNKDDNDEVFGDNKEEENVVNHDKGTPNKASTNIIMSRSVFARVDCTKSMVRENVMEKISKRFKSKPKEELSFSVKLDRLFHNIDNKSELNALIKENTMSYSPMKTRSSLRKAVLNKKYKRPVDKEEFLSFSDKTFNKSDALDTTTTLQITEILNELEDMSISVCTTKQNVLNLTNTIKKRDTQTNNIVTVNKNENISVYKRVWNIPIHSDSSDMSSDITGSSQASNVTTQERINDLDLVENRLNDLKMEHQETTL